MHGQWCESPVKVAQQPEASNRPTCLGCCWANRVHFNLPSAMGQLQSERRVESVWVLVGLVRGAGGAASVLASAARFACALLIEWVLRRGKGSRRLTVTLWERGGSSGRRRGFPEHCDLLPMQIRNSN